MPLDESYWTQRIRPFKNDDARNPYETDYSRVIHSASFRRLQGKTQILNLGDSDFYRTRLTHSLEVSQIAGGMFRELEIKYKDKEEKIVLEDKTLIQTIGLIHDLGHPPFGHGGEYALNFCMRDHGGFEGNGQTLRILSRLERFSRDAGSNLTYRTLLGCLKYPIPFSKALNVNAIKNVEKSKLAGEAIIEYTNPNVTERTLLNLKQCRPPKCYLDTEKSVVEKILEGVSQEDKNLFLTTKSNPGSHTKSIYKSFDCSLMDIADDISNGVHDLEDAISLKLISANDFTDIIGADTAKAYTNYLCEKYNYEYNNNTVYEKWVKQLFDKDGGNRKWQISRLVGFFINDVQIEIQNANFKEPIFKYKASLSSDRMDFVNALKDFVLKKVIKSPNVQHLEFKGQQMVIETFNTIAHEPKRFLPEPVFNKYEENNEDLRIICDHVAGMTDTYLMNFYERLYSPRMGSVFDHL